MNVRKSLIPRVCDEMRYYKKWMTVIATVRIGIFGMVLVCILVYPFHAFVCIFLVPGCCDRSF